MTPLSVILSVGMLLQESFIEEPDGLVSVNLLVVSAVSAFSTGAILSGLTVCWIMSHRHRHSRAAGANGSRRKNDKEQSMLGQGRSGSVMSVTRTSGGERRRSQADNLFVMPNGWPKGDIDPGLLPTPEQTPLQQKRVMCLPDTDWDQSQTFLTSVGTPCPNNAVIYLSSKFLHGGGGVVRIEDPGEVVLPPHTDRQRYLILATQRGEHGGSRPSGNLRNSAGEYIYPATPQESPDRRRVVSAPTAHMDYGEPRWSHEALNYNCNSGVPYHAQRQGLIRPDMHGPRGLGDLAEFGHLLGKNMGEHTPSGQWDEVGALSENPVCTNRTLCRLTILVQPYPFRPLSLSFNVRSDYRRERQERNKKQRIERKEKNPKLEMFLCS